MSEELSYRGGMLRRWTSYRPGQEVEEKEDDNGEWR